MTYLIGFFGLCCSIATGQNRSKNLRGPTTVEVSSLCYADKILIYSLISYEQY